MKNLYSGKHSLVVKKDCVIVESNFGRSSMRSTFKLSEYDKALTTFNALVNIN